MPLSSGPAPPPPHQPGAQNAGDPTSQVLCFCCLRSGFSSFSFSNYKGARDDRKICRIATTPSPLPTTCAVIRCDAPFTCLRNFSLLPGPLFYVHSDIQCSKLSVLCKCVCLIRGDPKASTKAAPRLPAFCVSSTVSTVRSMLSPVALSTCPAWGNNASSERCLGYRPISSRLPRLWLAASFSVSLASMLGGGRSLATFRIRFSFS